MILYNSHYLLLVVSIVISVISIAFLILKAKKNMTFFALLACILLVLIWSANDLYYHLCNIDSHEMFLPFLRIQYLFNSYIGCFWLILCLNLTESKLASKNRIYFFLILPPTVLYFLLLTNDYHYLFFKNTITIGPVFLLFVAVLFFYIAFGEIVLFNYALRKKGKQRYVPIFCAFIPIFPVIRVLADYSVSGIGIPLINKFFNENIIQVGFNISLIILVGITYSFMLKNLIPIAYNKIVESMKEAIVVLDENNKVVKLNNSFKNSFLNYFDLDINSNIMPFINFLYNNMSNSPDNKNVLTNIKQHSLPYFSGELHLLTPSEKWYSIYIQPVKKSNTDARIILLNDVTEYKKLLFELADKNEEITAMNEELLAANEQLRDYSEKVKELATVKERSRIAQDMHDSLGYAMTTLNAVLEVCYQSCDSNIVLTMEKLLEAKAIAKEGLSELRRSISGLKPQVLESNTLVASLRSLFDTFISSGVKVDFFVDGNFSCSDLSVSSAIYRIAQEALTNSLKHGNAKNINVILQFSEVAVKLFVFDDGIGCSSINKGNGLNSIEKRVKELTGSVVFGSNGEKGFNVNVEIPLAGISI